MRIVADTNVLISGLLSPFGPPGVVVAQIVSGSVSLCYDGRILAEYADVLSRETFQFSERSIAALLDAIQANGELTYAAPTPVRLPDPADEAFLEVALASMVDYLVTGNVRHFPAGARQGVRVVSPREFVNTGLRSP